MRNRILVIVALLTVSLLGTLPLAGCSKSKEGQASQDLSDAVNLARRHCERAVALMGGLNFKAGDETAPVSRKITPEEIAFQPVDAVNPKALDALKQAKDTLSAAIASTTDAPPQDIAQANLMMGQIYKLTGDYNAAVARSARNRGLAVLDQAQVQINSINSGVNLMKHFETMAAASEEDINKEIADASAEAQDAAKAQQDAQGKIDDLKKQLDDLNKADEKLLSESASLRVQSEGAKGDKKLELFDQALQKEAQAATNGAAISTIERKINSANSELAAAGLKNKDAAARKDVAEKTLAQRTKASTDLATAKEKVNAQITDLRKKFEAAADALAKNYEEAKAAQGEAVTNYEQAIAAFRKAGTTRDAKDALGAAQQSKALVETMLIGPSTQLTSLASDTETSYKKLTQALPPSIAILKDLLKDSASANQAAAADYDQAAQSFGQAASMLNSDPTSRKTQWVYLAQKAGALAGVARTSPDADKRAAAIKEARQIIADATDGKTNSPYVADTMRLKQSLDQAEATAPVGSATTTPASTPTTPAEPAPTPASAPAGSAATTATTPA